MTEREPSEPSWGQLLRWSALLLAISLTVGAIAIPILRWFGID